MSKRVPEGIKRPRCPYCGLEADLKSAADVYGGGAGADYSDIWVCPNAPCDARVGCHKGTIVPLGRLANAELRALRRRCHELVDLAWKSGRHRRVDTYKHVAEIMGIPRRAAHIGIFDKRQCELLIAKWKEPA